MTDKVVLKSIIEKLNGALSALASLKAEVESPSNGGKMAKDLEKDKAVAEEVKPEVEVKVAEVAVAEVTEVKEEKAEEPTEVEKAEAAQVTKSQLVVERTSVDDYENGQYATKTVTVETTVSQHVDSPASADAAKATDEVKVEAVVEEVAIVAVETVSLKDKLNSAMSSDDLSDLDLSEAQKALASQYSYVDLVKLASDLTLQVASFNEEKKKAAASALGETRFNELNKLGIALSGAKASSQKEKVTKMDDKAFASYKEELLGMKEAFSSSTAEEDIQKAKESAGDKAVAADLSLENRYNKYKLMK